MALFELHRVATAIGLDPQHKTPQQVAAAILAEFALLKSAAHPLQVLEGQIAEAVLCACGIQLEECNAGSLDSHVERIEQRAEAQRLWDEQRGVLPPAEPERTEGETTHDEAKSE